MSRFDSGNVKPKATPNVYTVLALIAVIGLGVAVGAVWHYTQVLTGSNPFELMSK